MPTLHIVEGPVGAGKTTYATELGRQIAAPPLVLDSWMATLFRPDRPESGLWQWYAERKQRCVSQIMSIARATLDHGHDAVVELGLIRVADRLAIYAELEKEGRAFRVHLLDAPREERWERVSERNRERGTTFSMHVSAEIFDLASDLWEPVSEEELAGRAGTFVFVAGSR
jgi:predicted kinase